MLEDLTSAIAESLGRIGIFASQGQALTGIQGIPLPKRREPEKPSWDNPTPLPAHVRSVQLNPRLLAVHMASARHPRNGMEWS